MCPQDTNIDALRLWETLPPGIYIANRGCANCGVERSLVTFPTTVAITIPNDQIRDPGAGYTNEGLLGLCVGCITRAAELIGLGKVENVLALLDRAEKELATTRQQLTDSQALVISYEAVFSNRKAAGLDPLPGEQALFPDPDPLPEVKTKAKKS